jgi:hypothetical protein
VFSDLVELSALPSLDAEYRFGRPKVYLAPHELARLTIVRSKLGDTRAEREAEASAAVAGRPAGGECRQPKKYAAIQAGN